MKLPIIAALSISALTLSSCGGTKAVASEENSQAEVTQKNRVTQHWNGLLQILTHDTSTVNFLI